MTVANVIADGRGFVAFSLEVEGWPDIWATDARLAGTQSDGRVRRPGLARTGLGFRDRVHIDTGKLDSSGFQAKIDDRYLAATVSFTTEPTIEIALTAAVDDVATSWQVSASADAVINNYYHCGVEVVKVTAKPDATHLTVARGQWGTVARSHTLGYLDRLQYPLLRDRPTLMVNRRVILRGFGADELTSSATGSILRRGTVAEAPKLDAKATSYSFSVQGLSKLLDQRIGPRNDQGVKIRGVYYAWDAPLRILLTESSGATYPIAIAHTAQVTLSGFWESQAAFVAALNTAISTATTAAGFTQQVIAVESGSQWHLEVRTTGTPKAVASSQGSAVDGFLDNSFVIDTRGAPTTTFAASSVYVLPWSDTPPPYAASAVNAYKDFTAARLRQVPRAQYGINFLSLPTVADSTTFPNTRLYLDRADQIQVGDYINEGAYTVTAKNAGGTVGTVDVDTRLTNGRAGMAFAGREGQWDLFPITRFGSAGGNLADFITALEADAPAETAGAVPWITVADVSVPAAELAAAAGGGGGLPFTRRLYQFRREQTLGDVVAGECLWYGLVPYINAAGKFSVRRLRIGVATEGTSVALAAGNKRRVRGGFGTVDYGSEGYFGSVIVSVGYDGTSDSFRDVVEVRNPRAIAALQTSKAITIDPRIACASDAEPTFDDIIAIAWPLITLFGERYAVVDVPVTIKDFGVLIGDTVLVTVPQLPFNGGRGIVNKPGLVLGTAWDLEHLTGTVTTLITSLAQRGYVPVARVTGTPVNITGNQWQVSIDTSVYFASGDDCTKHFAVGESCVLVEWDKSSPTRKVVTIDAVAAASLTFTVPTGWTPGASVWNVTFRDYSSGSTRQQGYGYLGGSDRRIAAGVPAASFGAG